MSYQSMEVYSPKQSPAFGNKNSFMAVLILKMFYLADPWKTNGKITSDRLMRNITRKLQTSLTFLTWSSKMEILMRNPTRFSSIIYN